MHLSWNQNRSGEPQKCKIDTLLILFVLIPGIAPSGGDSKWSVSVVWASSASPSSDMDLDLDAHCLKKMKNHSSWETNLILLFVWTSPWSMAKVHSLFSLCTEELLRFFVFTPSAFVIEAETICCQTLKILWENWPKDRLKTATTPGAYLANEVPRFSHSIPSREDRVEVVSQKGVNNCIQDENQHHSAHWCLTLLYCAEELVPVHPTAWKRIDC